MKRILFLVLLFVVATTLKAQYPVTQFLGSDSSMVKSRGGLQGRFAPIPFTDTTSANLSRISQYPGALIYTSGVDKYWYRNATVTGWIEFTSSGGATVNIYNSDGTLTGARILRGGNNSLTFDELVGFDVTSTSGAIQFNFFKSDGKSSYFILGDTIKINPNLGNLLIDTLNTTQDTSTYKPIVVDPVTGRVMQSSYWYGGSGGSGADSSVFATLYRVDTAKVNIRNSLNTKADTGLVWKRTGIHAVSGNFIGTTNKYPLYFRVGNVPYGYLADSSYPSTGNNYTYGRRAGEFIDPLMTNAIYALGERALRNMRHGGGDIGIGQYTFENLSDDGAGLGSASENIGLGHYVGRDATYAWKNALFGHYINTKIGYQNAVFGVHGHEESWDSHWNAGLGESVLRWIIRGKSNAATGNASQYLGTTVLDSIIIANPGSGYDVNDTVVIVPAPRASTIPGIPHTQAVVRVEISGGQVDNATVVTKGNGYGYRLGSDTMTVASSTGSGAILIAVYKSADFNTSDGAASLYFNEYGQYLLADGYAAGYGNGGNEATYNDMYSTFIGAYSSRSSRRSRLIPYYNVTAIGFGSKVGQDSLIALGKPNTRVTIGKDTIATTSYNIGLDASSAGTSGHVLSKGYYLLRGGGTMNSDYYDDVLYAESNTSGFTRTTIKNNGTHPESWAGYLMQSAAGTAFVRSGYAGVTELASYTGGLLNLNNYNKRVTLDASGKLTVLDGQFNAKKKSTFEDTIRYTNAPTGVKKYFLTMDDDGNVHRSDTTGLFGGSGGGSSDSSIFLVDTTYNRIASVYGTDTLVVKSLRVQYNGSTVTPTVTDSTISWNITGLSNPMTATGDIIYSSDGSGTPARLGVGTEGQVLMSNGSTPYWSDPSGGGLTKGITTIASSATRRILYDSAGILSNNALLLFNSSGELQIGSDTDLGAAKLQVTGNIMIPQSEYIYLGSTSKYLYNDANSVYLNSVSGTFLSSGGTIGAYVSNGKLAVGAYFGNPTARLHIAAGSATAATAPLKFTSGTNMTTAEAGAMEYNGTNLFFTPSSAARNSILMTASVNSVSPTSPNRTITVVIDGTTYYIHAKTTND